MKSLSFGGMIYLIALGKSNQRANSFIVVWLKATLQRYSMAYTFIYFLWQQRHRLPDYPILSPMVTLNRSFFRMDLKHNVCYCVSIFLLLYTAQFYLMPLKWLWHRIRCRIVVITNEPTKMFHFVSKSQH